MTKDDFYKLLAKKKKVNKILCFAHRGVSSLANDCSLESIRLGLTMKSVDGIEFDVQETADKHIIVHHNFALQTDRGLIWIKDLTLSQIRRYKSEEDAPLLSHALDLFVGSSKIIDIEVKSSGTVQRIIDLCKEKKVYQRVVLTSLYEGINEEIKKADEQLARIYGYPRDRGKNLVLRGFMQPIVKLAIIYIRSKIKSKVKKVLSFTDTPFISLYDKVITKEAVRFLHEKKCWCIGATFSLHGEAGERNSLSAMQRMVDLGVDLIITDYPQLASQLPGPTKKK